MSAAPTLDDIRAQLGAAIRKNVWDHALAVVDRIEVEAKKDWRYSLHVKLWLIDANHSTVWLRDVLMEPIRNTPEMREITASICRETADSLTNWHNTWMPLDAAMHRTRLGVDPEEW